MPLEGGGLAKGAVLGELRALEVRTPAVGHLGERKACIHHQPCRLGALQELRLRHIAAL